MPVASAAGVAAVIGEHRAGQVCPFFGIKFKSLHIHLVVIDKQDSFSGNNIILGSPFSQFPVLVSLPSCNAAGQERITASPQILQGGSGQQSFAAEQLHLYAFFKCNVLQINGYGILQSAVIMRNTGALDAAAIGKRSAGQVCPFFGIQCELLPILLVAIDNQDSFIGNNIILGSPFSQFPVLVSLPSCNAAGQERIAASLQFLQGGSGQQSFAAEQLHLYAICKCNVLQINGYGILQIAFLMRNNGALDAAGERSAGQGCPIFGIKREGLRILFVSIDNQDSFIGNNIILGSPGGQCPVCVSSLGSDAAGQETIVAGFYSLQGSRGQQSIAAVQLHLYAFFKFNVLQINGYGILQRAASIRNTGALDAAVAFCRCDSGQGADHDQSQHHCK